MKAILVLFDSLNRHMLPPYGCEWVHAPNFDRLAERCATFDNFYIGSAPCMPARRDLHTGRYSFLHRSWGPLEPFDDSMPRILRENGIYTHLVSDHYHYWETGGATYHAQYNSWQFSRGQEGDPWMGHVAEPPIPEVIPNSREGSPMFRQDWVNRLYMQNQEDLPQAKTFKLGLEFIDTNRDQDDWFLQIETFDPHEPFYTVSNFQELYPDDYIGPHFDWPNYGRVNETDEQVAHLRNQYAATLSMCDEYLGQLLDKMDQHDLWDDTLLIVTTDHGFLLGEHGWWGKTVQPFYNEVAQPPMFVWDPRSQIAGERRESLVQMIDIPATLIEYFAIPRPPDMQGQALDQTIALDKPVRDAALFGIFGGHVNCTDGRYVYMQSPAKPDNQPLYEYTLIPTHMREMFSVDELQDIQLAEPFPFTKGCRLLKIPGRDRLNLHKFGTLLFDLTSDPKQDTPILDPVIETMMVERLRLLMQANDAPPEQWRRLGLD
jgi:arylsulfatase A-like enzyme